MALDRTGYTPVKNQEQDLANRSFDRETDLNAVEAMVYDNATDQMVRQTHEAYGTNDVEEVGAVTYIGMEDKLSTWSVMKIDTTSGASLRIASIKNNVSVTTYSSAWTNRATLTYGTYSEA